MTAAPRCTPHPALIYTDGVPYSTLYGDVFRSRRGAADESRQVFVEGCRVRSRWAGADRFTVLEIGFGPGGNFLQTLAAWRADPARPRRLFYVGLEAHPLATADLAAALDASGAPAADAARLVAQWPLPVPGLHLIDFPDASGGVRLLLGFGDAQALLGRLSVAADAVYLDGFAPARNPAAWSAGTMRGIARVSRPGTAVASYSVAGGVQRTLRDAGFDVRLLPGFAGKAQRLEATYAPRWPTFPPPAPAPTWPERTATVVGAGLAGAAAAAALAIRGWQVQLVDPLGVARGAGSSQPRCADHLHVSPDDNSNARLTRSGLLMAPRLQWTGRRDGEAAGRLVLAADEADARRHRHLVEALGFPAAFVRSVAPDEAADLAGIALPRGGLWLPLAGSADPGAACRHWLGGLAPPIARRVDALRREGDAWHTLSADGTTITRSAIVVLANADDATRLGGLPPARRVAGQTTRIDGPAFAGLRCTLGGGAYGCPLDAGGTLIGATFEEVDGFQASDAGDQVNLARFARLVGRDPWALPVRVTERYAGIRSAMPDRMPMIGELPDAMAFHRQTAELARNARLPVPRATGLFGAFALGARGLLHAPLAGELIAAQVDGEPLPLERDLCATIDPARGLVRRLRRAGGGAAPIN